MQPQDFWGSLIAWYLFLGGLGAGAYLVGAAGRLVDTRLKPLTPVGLLIGPPAVALGTLLLLLDLGRPERFFMVFFRPSSSLIALGSWILSLFLIAGFIQIAYHILPSLKGKLSARADKTLWVIGSLAAIATALYTGFVLAVVKAIPSWNTPILPILFLVSAVSTGIGAVILGAPIYRRVFGRVAAAEVEGEALHTAGRNDMLLVVVELTILAFYLAVMASAGTVAAASMKALTSGAVAVAFWVGVVLIGLLVPLALEWLAVNNKRFAGVAAAAVPLLAAVCLIVGGLILRFVILGSGIQAPL